MSGQLAQTDPVPPARGLHRLAVLACCLVWPLIWVGGLVTTYDAGMAVPDWPETYGYNLFLYPYQKWWSGPFDLFVEHGHRLLGAVVGMVAIAMVIAAYLREPRIWVFYLAIGVLVAISSQGVLGGMRVVLADRTLAMIHGCVGPAVFALCVVAAVVTSRHWWRPVGSEDASERKTGLLMVGLAAGLCLISYLQLLLGAQLRHVQPTAAPGGLTMIIAIHVMTAFLLWLLSGLAWLGLRRCGDLTLSRPSVALIGLVGLQILLGTGTWVVNYGWPNLLAWFPGATAYVIQAKGFGDSLIVTAHVATGALILAVSTLVLMRVLRVRDRRRQATSMEKPSEQSPTQAPVSPVPV